MHHGFKWTRGAVPTIWLIAFDTHLQPSTITFHAKSLKCDDIQWQFRCHRIWWLKSYTIQFRRKPCAAHNSNRTLRSAMQHCNAAFHNGRVKSWEHDYMPVWNSHATLPTDQISVFEISMINIRIWTGLYHSKTRIRQMHCINRVSHIFYGKLLRHCLTVLNLNFMFCQP